MILHTGSHGGGTLPLNCREKRCLTWHKTRAANTFLETPRRLGFFLLHMLLLKDQEQSKPGQTLLQNILTSCCIKTYFPNYTLKDISLSVNWHAFTFLWESETEILVAVLFLQCLRSGLQEIPTIYNAMYMIQRRHMKKCPIALNGNIWSRHMLSGFPIDFRSSSNERKMSSSKTCARKISCFLWLQTQSSSS